jgi:hypothetical protein
MAGKARPARASQKRIACRDGDLFDAINQAVEGGVARFDSALQK